jgi:hypothetical protein
MQRGIAMANPTTTSPDPQPKPLPIDNSPPDLSQDHRRQADADSPGGAREDENTTIEDGDPGQVEIGDPVPEKDRTVRAAGEEQLPVDEDDPSVSVDPDPDPSTQRH